MRSLIATICLILAVFFGGPRMSWSAVLQKALTAAQKGDFATALREWKLLAEQVDASAQYNRDLMDHKGHESGSIQKLLLGWSWVHKGKDGC